MRAWMIVGCLAIACGKDGEEEEVTPVTACEANCDVQAQGEGCDAEGVARECADLCVFVAFAPEECDQLFIDMFTCLDGEAFTCVDSSLTVNDVLWPYQVDPEGCRAEQDAASECSDTTSTGT